MSPERLNKAGALRLGAALGVGDTPTERFEALASGLLAAGFDSIASSGVPLVLVDAYSHWRDGEVPGIGEELAQEMEALVTWLIEMRELP